MDDAVCTHTRRACNQNHLLAVYFFGIGNRAEVAASLVGGGTCFGSAHLISAVRLFYDICICQSSNRVPITAAAEKHTQSAVLKLYDFILGRTGVIFGCRNIFCTLPGRTIIGRIYHTGLFAACCFIKAYSDVAIADCRSFSGGNQEGCLSFFLNLCI